MAGFFDVLNQAPVPLGEQYPLFNRISIETSSFCNRKCSFCPVSTGRRDPEATGGLKYMGYELYDKVVRELHDLKFNGVAQMFLLNEPLLDKRLGTMCQSLRRHCPKVSIYVTTNGDPVRGPGVGVDLAIERLNVLYDAGVNVINLNVYDEGEKGAEQAKRYRELVSEIQRRYEVEYTTNKYRHHAPSKHYISLTDMRPERLTANAVDSFHLRGMGDVKPGSVPQRHCARPQRHMVVMYDGRVPICCAVDPTDAELPILGDVNKQSLTEIWNSEAYFKYRYFTQEGRRVLPGCSTCTHKMAYPHVVRQVTASEATVMKWNHEAEDELDKGTCKVGH